MTISATLPIDPLPHLAMDYARLRAEGLRLLERLAGTQWTDFNTHDPGITILEQLCYAITDLGYRINHPVNDLLAGGSEVDLPEPAQILSCHPVTTDDLRKLVLSVAGVTQAWVEVTEPDLVFYHHEESSQLRLDVDAAHPEASPVRLRGLHRVLVATVGQPAPEAGLHQVAELIHRCRTLGSDLELSQLGSCRIRVNASVEVDATEDPIALMADLFEALADYLAPPARLLSLAEARVRGHTIDQIYEGPELKSGFIDELPAPRRSVCVSDLHHVLMDVPAVRAVTSLELSGSSAVEQPRWVLDIPAEQVGTLCPGSQLTLRRGGLPLQVEPALVSEELARRRLARIRRSGDNRELTRPAGRDRQLARYSSIRRQLPAAYGVGPLGLPSSAPARRRAQARQFEAYLLLFDQLLANAFAQLAHAPTLLSPDESDLRTYFAQPVADLDAQELVALQPAAQVAWLHDQVEPGTSRERRQRFLAHLLARFAEQLGEPSRTGGETDPDQATIQARCEFLRRYPELSRARGSAYDIHGYAEAARSSFEERLRLKLRGVQGALSFHVVEHLLLRPVAEDSRQLCEEGEPQVPLLAGVSGPDPWSQQISFVFQASSNHDQDFERHVEQTVLAETPAHLMPHLFWFGDDDEGADWTTFEGAWHEFRVAYREYRAAKLRRTTVPQLLQLRVRDARDRVIDLLGFGRPYPLRDVPVPTHVLVLPGSPAVIPLPFSQRGVDYELRDRTTGQPILLPPDHEPSALSGTGQPIELPTPPIKEDDCYRILAVKQDGADTSERREVWLRGVVRMEEGVDSKVVATIELPPLDKQVDAPEPSDARIADYGVEVSVAVFESQEGVKYELIDHADHQRALSATVVGTSGTIRLNYGPTREDIDLRVRATKEHGDIDNPTVRSAVLDVVLPLRVRANPALAAELAPPIVTHGGNTAVRLEHTQSSASYQVFSKSIRDRDFVFDPTPGSATVDVEGDGGRVVCIQRPPTDAIPDGFASASEVMPGNDTRLGFLLGPQLVDALLLVQASKQHRAGPLNEYESPTIASTIQLDQALAVLVRPYPGQTLGLRMAIAGAAMTGPLLVHSGQPGVFYRLSIADREIGRPAYFHQRDDADDQLNKGIGQLRIEVDLALARDVETATNPRRTPPPWPVLDTVGLPVGSIVRVVARKAMTGLEAPLERTAPIPAIPVVSAEPATVEAGSTAKIVVAASVVGERYSLLREGELVGEPVAGNGDPIEFDTGVLTESTVFVAVFERAATLEALPVERRLEVMVDVRPS